MLDRVPLLGRIPRNLLVLMTVLVLAGAGGGFYLFQPWKAFTSTTVDEALPAPATTAAATSRPAGSAPTVAQTQGTPGNTSTPAAAPVELARGSFVSGEHDTSGTARVVRLSDGGIVLRLEDLRTSEGPDVRVYLSKRPAAESKADTLGDGAVELDHLKGNRGNQNYTIPVGTDLSQFHSAVIWCSRFSVGFGAADLTPAAK